MNFYLKDYPYLWPVIEQVCKEQDEKELFDTLVPTTPAALQKSLKDTLNAKN